MGGIFKSKRSVLPHVDLNNILHGSFRTFPLAVTCQSDHQDRLISEAYVTKSLLSVPKVLTDSPRLTLGAALPSLAINTKNNKNNSTNNMERPAKSVLTKWSNQKSNESCRRANATARFFAQFRRNKYRKKLPREVGAIPRCTNVDKHPTHGGKFGSNR